MYNGKGIHKKNTCATKRGDASPHPKLSVASRRPSILFLRLEYYWERAVNTFFVSFFFFELQHNWDWWIVPYCMSFVLLGGGGVDNRVYHGPNRVSP